MKTVLPVLVLGQVETSGRLGRARDLYVQYLEPVEIKEISVQDAPVAVSIQHDIGQDRVIRYFDGHFYERIDFRASDGSFPLPVTPDTLTPTRWTRHISSLATLFHPIYKTAVEAPGEAYSYNNYIEAFETSPRNINDRVIPENQVRDTSSTVGEKVSKIIEMRRAVEDKAIFIGGILHRQVDEPRYVVSFDRVNMLAEVEIEVENRKHGLQTGIARETPYFPPHQQASFRLDRLSDMIDYTEAAFHGPARFEVVCGPPPVIAMPEALQFNGEIDNMVRSAQYVVENDHADLLTASRAQAIHWLDLRDNAFHAGISPNDRNIAALQNVLVSYKDLTDNNKSREAIIHAVGRIKIRPLFPVDHFLQGMSR